MGYGGAAIVRVGAPMTTAAGAAPESCGMVGDPTLSSAVAVVREMRTLVGETRGEGGSTRTALKGGAEGGGCISGMATMVECVAEAPGVHEGEAHDVGMP